MLVRTAPGITTIALLQSLGTQSGNALHRTVLDLLAEGERTLIVDLLAVSRIDAAGLGELVRSFTAVRTNGGEMAVVVDRGQIRALLDVARLTTVLPTFGSVAEAAAKLAALRASA